ncbi:hypothetical protein ACYF6T_26805 [Streptomyces sp. 7R007]
MHRTTTTATLLVTVAVSALSGCVTVQRPPASGPPPTAAPSLPSAARPDGEAEPQIVQAPAREALKMIESTRRAEPGEPRRARPTAAAPAPARQPANPRPHPHHPHPRAAHPEPRHHPQRPPHVDVPPVPTNAADVCTLGRAYGGWRGDSPESVICKQTYGR